MERMAPALTAIAAVLAAIQIGGVAVVNAQEFSSDSASAYLEAEIAYYEEVLGDLVVVDVAVSGGLTALLALDGGGEIQVEIIGEGGLTKLVSIAVEGFDIVEPLSIRTVGEGVFEVYVRARKGVSEVVSMYRIDVAEGEAERVAEIVAGEGLLVYDAVLTPSGLLLAGSKFTVDGGWRAFIALYELDGGIVWELIVEGEYASRLAYSGGLACALLSPPKVACVDVNTGRLAGWPGSGVEEPESLAFSGRCIILVTSKRLSLLDTASGSISGLERTDRGRVLDADAWEEGLALLVASGGSTRLEVYGLDECRPEWRANLQPLVDIEAPVGFVAWSGNIISVVLPLGGGWQVAAYKVSTVEAEIGATETPTAGRDPLEALASPLATIALSLALVALLASAYLLKNSKRRA